MKSIWFARALLPQGWAASVRVGIDGANIVAIDRDVSPTSDDDRHDVGLPGLPNLHSHCFQRAMAGLAETDGGGGADDFWSWRETMYGLVANLAPEDVNSIAAMAFVEMLESGFTRVGEFHYLHHDDAGHDYDEPARMAVAIAAASTDADIALTLLPVFYAHSGFGGAPPSLRQHRFVSSIDGFARLHEASGQALAGLDHAVLGIAPHSLRAVTPQQLAALISLAPHGPIHIHVAEQVAEVQACLAWSGRRPVEWLTDNALVDARWCLVHATHVEPNEITAIAASQAVVGLCPITEANLGDGLFPAAALLDAGGRFGIGSDSNVRIDAAEELRLLEYGQRLTARRRNVLARQSHSTGRTLFSHALSGGAQALGVKDIGLSPGAAADIVALARPEHATPGDAAMDQWIFARGQVNAVWRAGRQVVRDGRHVRRREIAERYRRTLHLLRSR